MKRISIIFLLTIFFTVNLSAQTDSSLTHLSDNQKPSLSNIDLETSKSVKIISIGKKSDENSGMLIGAAVGAGAGVLLGLLAGNISMEPHSDNSVPFGTLVVAGVAGAFVGAIIGGIASK